MGDLVGKKVRVGTTVKKVEEGYPGGKVSEWGPRQKKDEREWMMGDRGDKKLSVGTAAERCCKGDLVGKVEMVEM